MTRGVTWPAEKTDLLLKLWDIHGGRAQRIAHAMGITKGAVSGAALRLELQYHGGRGRTLADNHEAVRRGVTVFPTTLRAPDRDVLKPGVNQRKLGAEVRKGRWKGYPIYSLTLEERATCPRSCAVYKACYGNGMQFARRYTHGTDLEVALSWQLGYLARRHRRGFVVRLHLLGDFWSASYVRFWRDALAAFPNLHIFGYTAWPAGTEIGDAVAALRDEQWDRFAVRTSGAAVGPRTFVVGKAEDRGDGIICPAQTGRTRNCSTCGICWQTKRAVAFLQH